MSIWLQLSLALLMLAGNAFFVGAEFGLVSSRRSSIELRALEGSKAAKVTLNAMEQISLMLAGAQLGVTVCSLILGAIGEPLIAHSLYQPFVAAGVSESLIHPASFVIALLALTYFHVVLGEMVPKNLALAGPTKAALWLTPPLVLFVKLTKPIVHLLNAVANGSIRIIGIKPKRELTSSFSRDEVAGFVKESHREGLLSEDEEQLLSGALSFDERTIKRVLLSTEELRTIRPHATYGDIEALATETGFSRFPVMNKNGELIGYVHLKDILATSADEQSTRVTKSQIRPLSALKQNTSLRRGLATMQRTGAHLAKVIDGKGLTIGIVALEDLLEELVGDILDDTQRHTT